jgi:hypothetical protein
LRSAASGRNPVQRTSAVISPPSRRGGRRRGRASLRPQAGACPPRRGAASARPTEVGHDGQEWRHHMEAGVPASAALAPEVGRSAGAPSRSRRECRIPIGAVARAALAASRHSSRSRLTCAAGWRGRPRPRRPRGQVQRWARGDTAVVASAARAGGGQTDRLSAEPRIRLGPANPVQGRSQ